MTDTELLARLAAFAAQEREDVADVVEHLSELDRRGCIADTGCATLFDYCTRVLRYSEGAAFLRIRAARAARKLPRILDDLRSGELHLDAVMRLYPHLTEENGERLLDLAAGKSKREVLSLVAGLSQDPVPERDVVRVCAAPAAVPGDAPDVIPPPSRVRISFTADNEFLEMIERLKGLRRHRHPSGRLEDLLKESVAAMLDRVDPARRGEAAASQSAGRRGRYIPRRVRRFVWRRDEGRCTFIGPGGIRCGSTSQLEVDHIRPFAEGGRSDDADNLRLLCRPHNQRLAARRFGSRK